MTIIYKKCLKCGSKNSVNIVYGMPSYELYQEAEAGKVKLGCCLLEPSNPEYACKDCEHEWNREQAIDHAYRKIKTIKASVGGYFGGYYDVTIDLRNLETTWNFYEGEVEETSKKSIRVSTAEAFLEELKILNLLKWKAKYIETGVCDGTQWSVEILTEGRSIKKNGDNKFPEEWQLFCRLLRKITNRKFQ
ncbi:MAG TPA: hypothetical protein DEF42_16915 [Desulfosporosinus sp.]|nr:hypothetical protein [Desulfosporosinus sp.]